MSEKVREPKMTFDTTEQMMECLNYWQRVLFLEAWTIIVRMSKPEDIPLANCVAGNDFKMENMVSCISIMKPEYYGDRVMKYCAELYLVHELLHLKYNWVMIDDTKYEEVYMDILEHQLIEQMAKSLIMARYDVSLSWFVDSSHIEVLKENKEVSK